jgi:hypothetical protein
MRNPYDRIDEFFADGNVLKVTGERGDINVMSFSDWQAVCDQTAVMVDDRTANKSTLTAESLDVLFTYALNKEIERDVAIFTPVIKHFASAIGDGSLEFKVLKDLRCAEKDRSSVVLVSPWIGFIDSVRIQGYMADPAYGGYRVDKHTVDAWRFEDVDLDTHPLFIPLRDALKNT